MSLRSTSIHTLKSLEFFKPLIDQLNDTEEAEISKVYLRSLLEITDQAVDILILHMLEPAHSDEHLEKLRRTQSFLTNIGWRPYALSKRKKSQSNG